MWPEFYLGLVLALLALSKSTNRLTLGFGARISAVPKDACSITSKQDSKQDSRCGDRSVVFVSQARSYFKLLQWPEFLVRMHTSPANSIAAAKVLSCYHSMQCSWSEIQLNRCDTRGRGMCACQSLCVTKIPVKKKQSEAWQALKVIKNDTK